MDNLNEEQREIAERVLTSNQHFFITGAAGTGKSFLLKKLITLFSEKYNDPFSVGITAMTGIAATSIGGMTLHSFVGLGHDGKRRPSKAVLDRWCKTKVLFIDEISMLTSDFLDAFYKYIIIYRVQIIAFGDFLQLPPVAGDYCFESKNWKKLKLDKNTIELTTIVRQKNKQFANVLNELRVGKMSKESLEYLQKLDISEANEIKDNATKIYAVNRNVNDENVRRLEELENEQVNLTCLDIVTRNKIKIQNFKMTTDPILCKMIDKEAPKQIKIKVGAEVILTKNRPDYILVNGSRGTVVEINNGIPKVEFRLVDSDKTLTTSIDRHVYEVKYKNLKVTRHQFPLKLSWALTSHRCQGMTLKNVVFNTEGSFENGQCYTGASRATEPEGLIIDSVEDLIHLNKVSKKALKYYKDFGKQKTIVEKLQELNV